MARDSAPASPDPDPSSPEHVRALLRTGAIAPASRLAIRACQDHPEDPARWLALADVHLAAQKPDLAVLACTEAERVAPTDPIVAIRLGQCLARLGRRTEALARAEVAAPRALGSAPLADGLGTLYAHCDEVDHAEPWFARAVALAPGDSAYRYNHATALRMQGRLDEAEAALDAVIAAEPDHAAAYLTLADLRTQSSDRNHVEALSAALARARDGDEVTLCFALAKELDDLGRDKDAFLALQRGCERQRSAMDYRPDDDLALLGQLATLHERTPARPGHDSAEPLFVFGLPRTGTTLLARMLGAHPAIEDAGELPAFALACQDVLREAGHAPPRSKLEFAQRALDADPARIGERYLALARPHAGRRAHFVDQLPLNGLYAGLIARALPGSRLILVTRDPMDAGYALYKTLFTAAYPYSYDLGELGRYIRAWNRLMDDWQRLLGTRLHVVAYESLVREPEAELRRLLAFCELPFSETCLEFHRSDRPVSTASAVQVRRPLYASSIGRWRRHAVALEPLRRALED